ncbi:cellulose binding domain-containing protein [Thermobispora bispora]|uniref:cellulose binding domain-containing protein n=1 Tax=Thermobispora bispora TaxID=2006 RepID=UPI001980157F
MRHGFAAAADLRSADPGHLPPSRPLRHRGHETLYRRQIRPVLMQSAETIDGQSAARLRGNVPANVRFVTQRCSSGKTYSAGGRYWVQTSDPSRLPPIVPWGQPDLAPRARGVIPPRGSARPTRDGAPRARADDPVGYNATIAPGTTVNIGFQATHTGDTAKPTAFTLNGVPCTAA